MTIHELLRRGRVRLAQAGMSSPRLDAEVLLMAQLGVDRAELLARLPEPVAPAIAAAFERAVARRAAGEPVAYITGQREFMGLDFLVEPGVLVPRPESEGLVEWGLARLQARDQPARVVDVGTGSGALAVSLAHHAAGQPIPAPFIVASDRSPAALRVAARNVARLAPGKVTLVRGDLLGWSRPGIDLILANLPYLRPEQANPSISWEPPEALFAAEEGFALYLALLPQAARLLAPGGALACEIDPAQRQIALNSARRWFPEADTRITVAPDLAGHDRYLFVERGGH
ncbi:MAG TPA: peptide chain release factor N(5)-glutamine methyltransferase [Thermomicrobiaceae bacterium]|nr:peptide chain release factor N(5)-glutamine methyltransferase [Thermomicrobiaceae bacterium]